MNYSQWIVIAVVLIPLSFVLNNKLRLDLAALAMAASLGVFQFAGLCILGPVNTPADAAKTFSGASQAVTIILISLFIITRGLEKSGVARWIAGQMISLGGKNTPRLILLFAVITAGLSLFMNDLAAAALVLPSAVEVARRTGIKPGKLLIPVAYGSLLGGSATYFTTANIVLSNSLQIASPPQQPLDILSFTPTGGLIALGGMVFFWLFGDRLLPNSEPNHQSIPVQRTGSDLEDIYQINEYLWQAHIQPDSPVIGRNLSQIDIGKKWGVTVAAHHPGARQPLILDTHQAILADSHLLVVGSPQTVGRLTSLGMDILPAAKPYHLSRQGIHLAEIILAPHSQWEGKTISQLMLRQHFGVSAIALQRRTKTFRSDIGEIPLSMGDTVLVVGTRQQIKSLRKNRDAILLETNPADQPIDLKEVALTVGITLTAIIASICGVPVEISMLSGATAMLLLNIVTMEEAYRAIEWQVIFLIVGMYAVNIAMVQTGLADCFGRWVLQLCWHFGGLGLAGGAYIMAAALTQLIGGQVAALIIGPITISAAIHLGVNPQAIAVATAIGCSASFLTPMAHPVNILMIAPANYEFKDFFRFGWPLTIISFLLLLAGMRIFWGLS